VEGRRILIVDDELELRSMVRRYLESEGFEIAEASNGADGLSRIRAISPDLVILDIGLPDVDGIELLRQIRSTSEIPVIMLTARAEELDRVVGLSVGADDYVTKPFSPRELVARIKAVLRRGRALAGQPVSEVLEFDGLSIDTAARTVERDGLTVGLSALEFDLLASLSAAPGRVFTRAQLLERVWGFDYFGVERVVDVHIGNIRKVLGDDPADPSFIGTVRGVGYKFVGRAR